VAAAEDLIPEPSREFEALSQVIQGLFVIPAAAETESSEPQCVENDERYLVLAADLEPLIESLNGPRMISLPVIRAAKSEGGHRLQPGVARLTSGTQRLGPRPPGVAQVTGDV